ncbi:hypothetical protein [Fictibacillus solisalsi]|uniref:hypothetical protein n=1 Tax=Fictibacillus solisalsi TaxID=459525 RepID=UPI000B7EEB94|nr:hypothetical protein [Fictibacillus solisalsi]
MPQWLADTGLFPSFKCKEHYHHKGNNYGWDWKKSTLFTSILSGFLWTPIIYIVAEKKPKPIGFGNKGGELLHKLISLIDSCSNIKMKEVFKKEF